ncbi:hypothetical protein [Desulforamulus ruminis]|uniref:Uncharacterized protein n=1 Tax=Desulforamulus ruminis (strain ATCC 23193 / DSM 2154 / NCIMB 8452 / DL) TaxID=696281 RepID=F6DTC0_DESRL|nr:hypothetical protein [Desulforamulus ruminis]AEG58937.1 hypothetical protein Desru_0652 [Desulforamulus ruminis DSM 2154]
MDRMKQMKMRQWAPVLFWVCFFFLAAPGMAFADLKEGAGNTKEVFAQYVIIAVLIVTIVAFLKKELAKAVVAAVIGAIILFVTEIDQLKSIGKSIVDLIFGK